MVGRKRAVAQKQEEQSTNGLAAGFHQHLRGILLLAQKIGFGDLKFQ
jgi:hypothetical protein